MGNPNHRQYDDPGPKASRNGKSDGLVLTGSAIIGCDPRRLLSGCSFKANFSDRQMNQWVVEMHGEAAGPCVAMGKCHADCQRGGWTKDVTPPLQDRASLTRCTVKMHTYVMQGRSDCGGAGVLRSIMPQRLLSSHLALLCDSRISVS